MLRAGEQDRALCRHPPKMSVSRLLALARKPHKAAAAGAGVAAGLCLAAVSERASAESMQGRWAWPSASAAETNRLPPGYASRVGNLKDEGAYKVGRKVSALAVQLCGPLH